MTNPDHTAIAELERTVARDPGGPDFPVLAELLRRAGRHGEAEAVLTRGLLEEPESLAGRCALLLLLADTGRSAQLRGRLEAWAEEAVSARHASLAGATSASDASDSGLSDSEFERAFDAAEPELDAMITPDSLAEEAALAADGDYATQRPLDESPTFNTRTMADLLERQGDAAGAARIRAMLEAAKAGHAEPDPDPDEASPDPVSPLLATLERWLANARRMRP